MAIGAGTFTLADYALYSNNPLVKNVSMSLIDYAAGANKFGVRPENKIDAGGAAVDISQAGMTAKTAAAFFEMLDLLLWCVDSQDGTGVVLYMNDFVKRRINSVIKFMGTSGGFDITRDQFDRSI